MANATRSAGGPLGPRMDPTPEEIYDFFKELEGQEFAFEIDRSDRSGKYFSQDALDKLNHELMIWTGTRMLRYGEQTGSPPAKMRLEVKVSFE